MKTFRIVEDDIDDDGKQDITIQKNDGKPIVTLYDWKTVIMGWLATTTSLFVAGFGLLSIF